MGYLLFLMVNVTLFIRPGDLFVDFAEIPIYEWSILGACVTSTVSITKQLKSEMVTRRPITACILGVFSAIVLSQVAFSFWDVRMSAYEFGKVLIYYLLLVGLLTSRRRLNAFLNLLTLCILILGILPVLQDQGVIHLDALEALQQVERDQATGDVYYIPRLQSTGIFNDPNDLATIAAIGVVFCLHLSATSSWVGCRPFWLGGVMLLGYVLNQTHSRGGLIALIASVVAYFTARFGWRRAAPLLLAGIPIIFVLFSARATNLSTSGGTGQARIQLWSEGLTMLRGAPLFGVGFNRYVDHASQLAHNAFVNSYAELGFIGGTCFFGAFAIACALLTRSRTLICGVEDPENECLRSCLFGITVGYIAGLFSLSRAYVVPTYMVLGLNTVWFNLAGVEARAPQFWVAAPLIKRIVLTSAVFVFAIYLYVRVFARWS